MVDQVLSGSSECRHENEAIHCQNSQPLDYCIRVAACRLVFPSIAGWVVNSKEREARRTFQVKLRHPRGRCNHIRHFLGETQAPRVII